MTDRCCWPPDSSRECGAALDRPGWPWCDRHVRDFLTVGGRWLDVPPPYLTDPAAIEYRRQRNAAGLTRG